MPHESAKSTPPLGRMMVWFFLLFSFSAFAQMDLNAIKELDKELPEYRKFKISEEEIEMQRSNRQHRPPSKHVPLKDIISSGTQMGAINPGAQVNNFVEDKTYKVTKPMFVKVFNLEDEHGYKYLQSKDGSARWKIISRQFEPIKEELSLYVPPLRYTPAPPISRTEYDRKLHLLPEVSFYAGTVQGSYMKDLFNDNKANSGLSNQYGLHYFTKWKLPIKVGAVLHYEKSSYRLDNGGQVIYSAPSLGPQFRTREFEILGQPIRFQTQFRISPFAKATAETVNGNATIKFNSADLLGSIERPIKNRFGEFVLGLYVQSQWLNIRDQEAQVRINASNATNKSYGIMFGQVFE
jgi:hypothetical protein